ncbi:MAG: hypothetical protein ACO1QR_11910 [Chthoniobacteraceae bacterium]
MSAVCVLTPIVIVAWPSFAATVMAAATSLGYVAMEETGRRIGETRKDAGTSVELDIAQSEIVSSQLDRDQRISVSRDGITITFSRDARGKAALCVTGRNHSKEELRAAGEALSKRVVQQHVYERLLEEMSSRGYTIAEEAVEADQSIRLRISHWEN